MHRTGVHGIVLTCTKVGLLARNFSGKCSPKFIKIPLKRSKALPYLLFRLFVQRRNEAKRETNRQCRIRGTFSLKQVTRDSAEDKRINPGIQQQLNCLPFQTARKASRPNIFALSNRRRISLAFREVQVHKTFLPICSERCALNEGLKKLSRGKTFLARLGFVFPLV